MESLFEQWVQALQNAQIKHISDDHCCKLLAWLYRYGGSNEAVIYNKKLNTNILYAQRRLNIIGGEVPDVELFPTLQVYLGQVKDFHSKNHPDWAYEICDYYNLSRNCIQ